MNKKNSVTFRAYVRELKKRALATGDPQYRVLLEEVPGEEASAVLVAAPADAPVRVTIESD